MMEGWQRYWRLQGIRDNPPTLEYLRTYVQEMAYIDPYKLDEHPRTLRRRVYWTLRGMAEAGNPRRVMRIMQLHPSAERERI